MATKTKKQPTARELELIVETLNPNYCGETPRSKEGYERQTLYPTNKQEISEMAEACYEEDIARRREEGEAICERCGYALGYCPNCKVEGAERYCRTCGYCEACGEVRA